MSDLAERLSAAGRHVASRWNAQREQSVWTRVERARRSESRTRLMVAAAACVAILAVVLAWRWLDADSGRAASADAAAAASTTAPMRLSDGSTIAPLSPGTRFVPVRDAPTGTTIRLLEGAARFVVAPRDHGPFTVHAGPLMVRVLGTAFRVSLDEKTVGVVVESGRVRLTWPEGTTELGPGEERTLSIAAALRARSKTAPSIDSDDGASASDSQTPTPAAGATLSWKTLAGLGEYGRAYERMHAQGPAAVHNDVGDLLLAADVARLGGHPDEAAQYLQRVVDSHRGDPRAPLAAFTLGRILLDQLGRPAEAAQAFDTSRRLSPAGAMAEDALAREVVSWARAGNTSAAQTRAREYLRRYPNGRLTKSMQRHAGLP